ncbi:zf-HC2 domain-containing protein [Actinoplanes bogorensis]|uniref:Zf-HC2 domain-containing protein n=1 Tax=Paractinoplanes bogorensis TaxID=1610840 RepID=A0ABS5YX75_9ACTN|nr:zf-HC2 domain-containing protein [Actinoplanes bogorensis]MBU2668035.1 zf-HC2 domain-containing protein [Actinoplanes bogorensis]
MGRNGRTHALVGAYALDAVDDLERAAFERHMRDCDGCRAECAELREAAARLADDAWSPPPGRLRHTVLTAATNTRQNRPPRRPGPAVVMIAVLVTAIGTVPQREPAPRSTQLGTSGPGRERA